MFLCIRDQCSQSPHADIAHVQRGQMVDTSVSQIRHAGVRSLEPANSRGREGREFFESFVR